MIFTTNNCTAVDIRRCYDSADESDLHRMCHELVRDSYLSQILDWYVILAFASLVRCLYRRLHCLECSKPQTSLIPLSGTHFPHHFDHFEDLHARAPYG